MPIDPEDVTDGYWYVRNTNMSGYSIIRVFEGYPLVCGMKLDRTARLENYTFLAPVPAITKVADISPDTVRNEMVKLRQELNLPVHASVTEVFRAALALAKTTLAEHREKSS